MVQYVSIVHVSIVAAKFAKGILPRLAVASHSSAVMAELFFKSYSSLYVVLYGMRPSTSNNHLADYKSCEPWV